MRRSHTLPAARALALLRIVAGGVLVWAGYGKMTWYWVADRVPLPVTSVVWQREMPERLAAWLAGHTDGVLAAVVRDLILPNGHLFAGLVAWTQLIAGTLLVLGLFTRLSAAAAGVVIAFLALMASIQGSLDARPYLLLLALAIALAIGDAGQSYGWDGVRRERNKDWGM